jgi:hypothetical protein
MTQLLPEFREFLNLLNSTGVKYLLVGGHAVAFHGHPRATGDIGFWVAPDEANLTRVRESLYRFGFSAAALPATVFEPGKEVLRIGMAALPY